MKRNVRTMYWHIINTLSTMLMQKRNCDTQSSIKRHCYPLLSY